MGIVIRNKARLVAQGYTQEEGIDYDEIEEAVYVCQPLVFKDPDFPDKVYKVEKALYGLHQDPRAWYETLSTYLLDNGFQRGKIGKTLFIKRHKGDILLMSSIGELTFFLGLQVKQKKDGIFISQDKYVEEILKKFRFTEVKTTSIPMETQKPLPKDEDGEEVDVHMYRSIIGSLMYLTSSRPNIMFAVCACAGYQVNPKASHLHVVKRIFSDYAGASLDRKSTTGGCQFLGCRLISWQCKKQTVIDDGKAFWNGIGVNTDGKKIIINESSVRRDLKLEDKEDEAVHKELGDSLVRAATTASSLEAEQNSGNITKTRSKATLNESSSLGTTSSGGPRCQETIGDTIAQTRVLDLEKTKTSQANEISTLKRRVKKLEKKDRSRTHKLKRLYKVVLLVIVSTASAATTVSAATTTTAIIKTVDDITLAQALEEMKSTKPKKKGVVIQELEPVKPMNKKDQIIRVDEETALNLQAEFDEEERLAREKAKKEEEANIALIETWDDMQVKIDVGHQLAERIVGERKRKKAGTELIQEITKKQKVDDDKETTELKQLMKIIPNEEEVAIDVIPLVVYQMLKSFDMEDLEDLYKWVKAKYESTTPVEDLDLLLGIYMLVEKKYPLASLTLSMMLEKKLIIDHESEMAYQFPKFIIKQLKK
ncbi:putative ribonuclease H-like domain-containing protein [Tanacetum coccineum]